MSTSFRIANPCPSAVLRQDRFTMRNSPGNSTVQMSSQYVMDWHVVRLDLSYSSFVDHFRGQPQTKRI